MGLPIWSELPDVLFMSTLNDALQDQIADLELAGFHPWADPLVGRAGLQPGPFFYI